MDEVRAVAARTEGVHEVSDVHARWIGHKIHVEVNVAVAPELTVAEGHAIATTVQHELIHSINYLSLVVVHVDPEHESGEHHHRLTREISDKSGAHTQ